MINWRQVKPWARLTGGLLFGAACVWLSIRNTRIDAVLGEIAGLGRAWVGFALAGVLLVSAAKALRWQWLYPPTMPRLAWSVHFGILITSQMLNLLVPIRLGELARVGLMRSEGRPLAGTLATIVVEKSLDLLAVQALVLIAALLAIVPDWLRTRTGLGALVVTLGVPLALVVLIRLRGTLTRVSAHLPDAERSAGAHFLQRMVGLFRTMLDSIAALERSQLLRLVGLTAGIWLASLAVIQMMLAAFAVPVDWGAALLLMLAVTFSNWVPAPPGLIGVIGAVTVVVLGPFGVAPARALALGTVLNAVLIVPPIVLGAWATWMRLWRLPATNHAARLAAALGINRHSVPGPEQQSEGPLT